MSQKVFLLVSVLLVMACSSRHKNLPEGIEVIPVEVDKVSSDASMFLEKIEIVPLETNDSSLLRLS